MNEENINSRQLYHQIKRLEEEVSELRRRLYEGDGVNQRITKLESEQEGFVRQLDWILQNEDDLRALIRAQRHQSQEQGNKSIIDAIGRHQRVSEDQLQEQSEGNALYKWITFVMAIWLIIQEFGCKIWPNLFICT